MGFVVLISQDLHVFIVPGEFPVKVSQGCFSGLITKTFLANGIPSYQSGMREGAVENYKLGLALRTKDCVLTGYHHGTETLI